MENVFEKAKMQCGELDYVCVAVGPGSFTGIRIGIAVAKGICDANSKNIIPVDTLSLIAYNTANSVDFVVIKGITNEYFVGEELLKKLSPFSKLATIDDLSPDGFPCDVERIEKLDMRRIAFDNIENAVDSVYVEPLYLRLSQAEMQKGAKNANS